MVFRLRFLYPSGHAAATMYTRADDLDEATRKGRAVVRERLHPSFFEATAALRGDVRFYQAEAVGPELPVPPNAIWV